MYFHKIFSNRPDPAVMAIEGDMMIRKTLVRRYARISRALKRYTKVTHSLLLSIADP